MQPPPSAPPPLEVSAEMLSGILSSLPQQELSLATPQSALRVTHRRLKDATIYLLFNESATQIAPNLTFEHGRRVDGWNPDTGETARAPSQRTSTHGLKITLNLPAYGTQLLVVR